MICRFSLSASIADHVRLLVYFVLTLHCTLSLAESLSNESTLSPFTSTETVNSEEHTSSLDPTRSVFETKAETDSESDPNASTLIVINNNVSRQPPPTRPTTTSNGELTDYPSGQPSSVPPSIASSIAENHVSPSATPASVSYDVSLLSSEVSSQQSASSQPTVTMDSINSAQTSQTDPESIVSSLNNSSHLSEHPIYKNSNSELTNSYASSSSSNTDLASNSNEMKPSLYSPELHMRPYNSATNSNSNNAGLNSNNNPAASLDSIQSASSENRLRWIDYRNRPAYPPRMPPVHGIPSGFRNPTASQPTLPNVAATATANSGILGPTISASPANAAGPSSVNSPPATNGAAYLNNQMHSLGLNSLAPNSPLNPNPLNPMSNNLNFASIVNSLAVPNMHTPAFGGSSSNPVGFPYPNPNMPVISNSLIGPGSLVTSASDLEAEIEAGLASATHSFSRRPGMNITRVEHIAAECSDDYMKVIVNFNGTFTGLVYSSGYVHDANCIYVNGTGRSSYEFYIRLNQCGTMGREEMHHPKRPGEVRRRDQVMWNTLSIQYNGLIEEEWDEHYRVTCEYGSDYWKTVTFPSFNVEVNTGSPVVFTINPPQCQMEVRRGFGIAGSRTSGPVTVGDPLTLLIHMKSEKAGFDILVKNCISHNGANQRLQLIDTNGCVTNEKLISPFRGTYNSDDGHQVTLYAYLKAFRFTGSPALYLECDIHMCHNKCPPQRCYWRNLSKRSIREQDLIEEEEESGKTIPIGRANFTIAPDTTTKSPVISESLSLFQALEVRHSEDSDEPIENNELHYRHLDQEEQTNGDEEQSSTFISNNRHHKRYRRPSTQSPSESNSLDELREDNKFCFSGPNVLFFALTSVLVLCSAVFTSFLSCWKIRQMRQRLSGDCERDFISVLSKSSRPIYHRALGHHRY